MKIIGLAGQAGAGKDYVFNYVKDHHLGIANPMIVLRVAYADGVREEIEDTLQVDSEVLWTKPYPESVRRLLQWWGTEYRRAQDPDYWVKKGMAEAKRLADGEHVHLVIITDVRFANEAKIIREAGGLVYEVVASDDVRRERLGGELPPSHASEEIDFDTDGVIANNVNGQVPIVPGTFFNYCGGD